MTTIRPYNDEDWDAICEIHDAARPDELNGSCDPRAFVPIKEDREVTDLMKSKKYVAEVSGNMAGFVGYDGQYLAWLYVDPHFYRLGIGRKLLQKGLTEINGKAWTIVLAGNTNAINLYKSEGFIEVRRFESENAGYPCTCLRLETSASFQ